MTENRTPQGDDSAAGPVPDRPGLAARGTQDHGYIDAPEVDAEQTDKPETEAGTRDEERPAVGRPATAGRATRPALRSRPWSSGWRA
jgi:hypothetical protein